MKQHTLAILVGMSLAFAATAQPQIVNVGVLPGASSSYAEGISPDGQYVTGASGGEGFIFSESEGLTGFSGPGPSLFSEAVSSNGFVAGFRLNGGYSAFRWSIGAGYQDLGSLLPDYPHAWAYDISADGDTVVGASQAPSSFLGGAFRWTPSTGMQNIGALPGGRSQAYAVSSNGNWIVGASSRSSPFRQGLAFRWSDATGMTVLRQLDIPNEQNLVYTTTDVSDDGQFVIGYASIFQGGRVCLLWTGEDSVRQIPNPDGSPIDSPYLLSLSGDGSTAVGWDGGGEAVVWAEELGTRYLKQYLESSGTDMTGWSGLITANSISSDGSRIAGEGRYEGQRTAFLIKDFSIVLPCPADLNSDGNLTFSDIVLFLDAFNAQDVLADLNDDGLFSFSDISAFLGAFQAGCP